MKKNSTDDNEKPTIVCYRPFIVMLFFIFKKVGQWPNILHYDWDFLNCKNNTNCSPLLKMKYNSWMEVTLNIYKALSFPSQFL